MKSPRIQKLSDARTVKKFIPRAILIVGHSLLYDEERLVGLAFPKYSDHLAVSKVGPQVYLGFKPFPLVDVETLESAVARLRPLLIPGDAIHYDAVITSVRNLVGAEHLDEEFTGWLDGVEKAFAKCDPNTSPKQWYSKASDDASEMKARQVFGAWIYGRLIHDDQERLSDLNELHDEDTRWEVQRMVCCLLLAASELLLLIRCLDDDGLVSFPEGTFYCARPPRLDEYSPIIEGLSVGPSRIPLHELINDWGHPVHQSLIESGVFLSREESRYAPWAHEGIRDGSSCPQCRVEAMAAGDLTSAVTCS